MIPPCLTLINIRYVARVKWNNFGKGVAPSSTPRCRSFWKESLLISLHYGCQLYLCVCVCVCVRVCVYVCLCGRVFQTGNEIIIKTKKTYVSYCHMDLALNSLQGLMCHEIQTTKPSRYVENMNDLEVIF